MLTDGCKKFLNFLISIKSFNFEPTDFQTCSYWQSAVLLILFLVGRFNRFWLIKRHRIGPYFIIIVIFLCFDLCSVSKYPSKKSSVSKCRCLCVDESRIDKTCKRWPLEIDENFLLSLLFLAALIFSKSSSFGLFGWNFGQPESLLGNGAYFFVSDKSWNANAYLYS